MTDRIPSLTQRIGIAAKNGLLWSVDRACRIAIFFGIIWLFSGDEASDPSPKLIDATVADLGIGLLVPALLAVFFWKLLTDKGDPK